MDTEGDLWRVGFWKMTIFSKRYSRNILRRRLLITSANYITLCVNTTKGHTIFFSNNHTQFPSKKSSKTVIVLVWGNTMATPHQQISSVKLTRCSRTRRKKANTRARTVQNRQGSSRLGYLICISVRVSRMDRMFVDGVSWRLVGNRIFLEWTGEAVSDRRIGFAVLQRFWVCCFLKLVLQGGIRLNSIRVPLWMCSGE